jgi:hypothetical protein
MDLSISIGDNYIFQLLFLTFDFHIYILEKNLCLYNPLLQTLTTPTYLPHHARQKAYNPKTPNHQEREENQGMHLNLCISNK